jgi:hypothetical protein
VVANTVGATRSQATTTRPVSERSAGPGGKAIRACGAHTQQLSGPKPRLHRTSGHKGTQTPSR